LAGLPSRYFSGRSVPLSLAISVRVGAVSTGDGYDHLLWRNGEFCVAVGPFIRTVGSILSNLKGQSGFRDVRPIGDMKHDAEKIKIKIRDQPIEW